MPWVSRLQTIPKLTGGYNWVIGYWYMVSKNGNNVTVYDLLGVNIVLTSKQAKAVFSKPQWVQEYNVEMVAVLDYDFVHGQAHTNHMHDMWNKKLKN